MITVQDFISHSSCLYDSAFFSLIKKKPSNYNVTKKFYLLLHVLLFAGCYGDGKLCRPYPVTNENRSAVAGLDPKCTQLRADLCMQSLCFLKYIRKKY